eukprot:31336-Pelagococcus_subviridis.AAC.5
MAARPRDRIATVDALTRATPRFRSARPPPPRGRLLPVPAHLRAPVRRAPRHVDAARQPDRALEVLPLRLRPLPQPRELVLRALSPSVRRLRLLRLRVALPARRARLDHQRLALASQVSIQRLRSAASIERVVEVLLDRSNRVVFTLELNARRVLRGVQLVLELARALLRLLQLGARRPKRVVGGDAIRRARALARAKPRARLGGLPLVIRGHLRRHGRGALGLFQA